MELFKLLGTIAINNSEANKAIDDTTGKGERAESKLSASFEKIGGAAVKVGAVVAKGAAVGASAIATLTGMAVKSYADYEQLVGGVETLFGTKGMSINEYAISVGKSVDMIGAEYNRLKMAQDWVMSNASEAYKTAGMSANEYMETVTSFSASLIQSLDGDTLKAAEAADQAIIDMSDNANKMGTSMESIQTAYQGFAKQNYTMLDNLKLGYGGTATEMARLVNDSGVLGDAMIDLTDTQNIGAALAEVGFAKITEAIHVVQTEMGITGTTAKEANETISGSLASTKAAWQNLVTGMADDNADVGQLIDGLAESAGAFAKNMIPRIQIAMEGIGNVVQKALPGILEKAVPAVMNMLPSLLSTTMKLLKTLATSIGKNLPSLFVNLLPQSVKDIMDEAHDYLCDTVMFGFDAVWESIQSLASAFTPLVDAVKGFLEPLTDLETQQGLNVEIAGFLEEALYTLSDVINQAAGYIQPFIDRIAEAITWLGENWSTIAGGIAETFSVLWEVCQSVWENIGKPIWDIIQSAILIVYDAFADIMPQVLEFFEGAVAGIKDSWEKHLKPALDAIGTFLNDVVKPIFEEVFEGIIQPLVENVFNYIKDLWEGTLKPVFDGICDFLTGVFTLDFETALNGLQEIADGVFYGILATVEAVFSTIKDTITGAIDKVKEFFGFAEDANEVELPSGEATTEGAVASKSASATTISANSVAFTPMATNSVMYNVASTMAPSGNDDIVGAITNALHDLALNVTVTVDPDSKGIFKIVQTEAEVWKESTGKGAFA